MNKSDMSDFYCNLFKSNVVFGVNNIFKLVQKDVEFFGLLLQVEDEIKLFMSIVFDVDFDFGLKREER